MLAPLATFEEFRDRIPGGIDEADRPRAEALLSDASTLVRAVAGETWQDEDEVVPDICVMICMAAAKRAFLNPDNVKSESIDGEYATTFALTSSDVMLTPAEEQAIHQALGTAGLWTQSTTRGGPDVSTVRGYVGVVVAQEEIDPFELV